MGAREWYGYPARQNRSVITAGDRGERAHTMIDSVPPSAASPSPARAWRPLLVGGVALLAIAIGVVAGSVLLSARTALGSAGAAAGYVPADAPMYLEYRLVPSAAQDAALRDVLSRFPATGVDTDRPLADQVTELIDESFTGGQLNFTYADDVAPWFDGRVGMSLNELPPTPDPTAAPSPDATAPVPSFTVMLGVTDAAAATATADRLRTEAGADVTFTSSDHAGTTIWTATGTTAGSGGAYAITDDQVLLSASAADIQRALDVHAGREPGLLDATQRLGPLADRLPNDWLFLMAMSGDAVRAALQADVEASQPEMASFYTALLQDQPLDMVLAAYATADGIAVDGAMSAPTGDLAVENRDRGLAAQVPADAILFADGGRLGVSLSRAIEAFKAQVSAIDEAMAGQVDDVESSLGASLEDFVAWMEDGAVAAGWDGSEPWGGLVITPNDAAAARERLDQLAGFARLAALDPTLGITVTDETVAGAEVTTIRFEPPAAAPAVPASSVSAQFAVTDERVLIGFGDAFVSGALELAPTDSLAQSERFRAAIDGLGGASNAGSFYLDLTALRVAVEGAIAGVLPTYESDVKPWLEPLDYAAGVTRVDGDAMVTEFRLVIK
jgi:hypothetical protein